jgi:hypothetical protein
MKRFFLSAIFSFCFLFSHAQNFKKVSIKDSLNNSGCSLYAFCDLRFEKAFSEDSSMLWVGECSKDDLIYGVICVKLLTPAADLNGAEEILISYLDYLKTSFKIAKAVGYGKGHRLANHENTRGIIDYWEDNEKNNWKIKGWTNGKYIGVMYGYSSKELPESRLNLYLDGFRFPGM